jgi:hypothetical protein
MSSDADNGQYIRRVVLPSGRAIDVVYFEPLADDGVDPASGPVRELHECPSCECDLVYPVEWQEVSPTHWEVLLRCPNCEWSEVGTFDQPTVERFDKRLDTGTETLIGDLRRMQQANMEEEIVRFVHALDAGAILPEDF